VISVYGKKRWNTEISLGYSRVHLPMLGSNESNQSIVAPIVIPKSSNMIAQMSNWLAGTNPELKNPNILTDGSKTKRLFGCFILLEHYYKDFFENIYRTFSGILW